MRMVSRLTLGVALFSCLAGLAATAAQQSPAVHKPAIVSTTHPQDSRGETVYEEQGDTQQGVPVVPGLLLAPEPLNQIKPKIPVSSRMHHRKLNITVEGVVAANGDV